VTQFLSEGDSNTKYRPSKRIEMDAMKTRTRNSTVTQKIFSRCRKDPKENPCHVIVIR
jgi:hypothetical protein